MFIARKAACGVLAAAMLLVAGTATAEEGSLSVGVSGGTLGISPEVGYRLNRAFGVRVNGGFFDYDRTMDIDDVEYDATLKLKSVGVMADLYPFGGSLRISVGLRSNKNRIDALKDSGVVTIGEEEEDFDETQYGTMRARASFKKTAPAVTIGYGGELKKGFHVGLEAGVVLQGSPRMSLTSEGGSLSDDSDFLAILEEERASAEDDARDYKLWPVVQLHFKYRF